MKKILPLIFALLLISCAGGEDNANLFPDLENEIPVMGKLPIDGTWESVILNKHFTVIIDRGRMYFEKSKRIIVKNIVKKKNGYSGESVFVKYGFFDSYIPVNIEVVSDNKIILNVPKIEGKINGQTEVYTRVGTINSNSSISIISIDLNESNVPYEVSSELVEVVEGAKVRIKRSRTIEHTIDVNLNRIVEMGVEIEGELYSVEISGAIKKEISKKQGQEIKQIESIEQEVELDGNVNQKFKLVWYDILRTGKADFMYENKKISIPFQYKESAELRVRNAN